MIPGTPFIDVQGRSTERQRPTLKPEEFIDWVLAELAISRDEISGRTKQQNVVRTREILMALGVGRYKLRVKDLATNLGVPYDTASLWGRRGATRRKDDHDFAERMDEIDAMISAKSLE